MGCRPLCPPVCRWETAAWSMRAPGRGPCPADPCWCSGSAECPLLTPTGVHRCGQKAGGAGPDGQDPAVLGPPSPSPPGSWPRLGPPHRPPSMSRLHADAPGSVQVGLLSRARSQTSSHTCKAALRTSPGVLAAGTQPRPGREPAPYAVAATVNGAGVRTLTSVVPLPRPDWGTGQSRTACEPRARQARRGPGGVPEDSSVVGTQPGGAVVLEGKRDAHRWGEGGGWGVLSWAAEGWAVPGEGSRAGSPAGPSEAGSPAAMPSLARAALQSEEARQKARRVARPSCP